MHKIYAYVLYGMWVHFRAYPIIFLPLILVYEYRHFLNGSKSKFVGTFMKIGLIAGGLFIFLLVLFYSLYGEDFIHESYLYHFTRKDNRHSFSPFFYDIYLNFAESKPLRCLPALVFIFVMTHTMSRKYSIFYLQFLITFAFVEFNTVITLQYYEWVFGALLLVLPESRIITFSQHRKGFNLALQWFFGISIWIWMSMKLEGDGDNILFGMWVICLGKILLDLWVLLQFMKTVKVQDEKEIKMINL
jgi:phosphatidylinositol glycan class M